GGHPGAEAVTVRPAAEPIGMHTLINGTVAFGFAPPFGHTTGAILERVANAAADHGALSFRPPPRRAILAIALSPTAAGHLREAIAAEGFMVYPSDARRHVIACAGAPACTSAQLPTRHLAPEIARATQRLVGTSNIVHLSGCSKGCAHPGPAVLTVV